MNKQIKQTTLNGEIAQRNLIITPPPGGGVISWKLVDYFSNVQKSGHTIIPNQIMFNSEAYKYVLKSIYPDFEVIDNQKAGYGKPDFEMRKDHVIIKVEIKNKGDTLSLKQLDYMFNSKSLLLMINYSSGFIDYNTQNYYRIFEQFYLDFGNKGLSVPDLKDRMKRAGKSYGLNNLQRNIDRMKRRDFIVLCAMNVGPTRRRKYYKITERGAIFWEQLLSKKVSIIL